MRNSINQNAANRGVGNRLSEELFNIASHAGMSEDNKNFNLHT